MKKLLLITAFLTAISCTHHNQEVKLAFRSTADRASIGNNVPVTLRVFDDRKNTAIIGDKKFGDEKIEITADQNLATFLQEKIAADLVQKGFKIDKGTVAEVHIEAITYKAERHFPVGNSEARAAIKIVVKGGLLKSEFTKNYKLDLNNKHFIAPLESTDAQTINALLQEISADIVNDEAFLQSLKN